MAASVLQEFVATLGWRIDEASQRRFSDAIGSMTKMVETLSLGLAEAAAAVVTAVSGMADSASKMQYLAQNLHDSVKNVDAFKFAMRELGITGEETDAVLNNVANNIKNSPGARQFLESFAPGKSTIDQLKAFAEAYRNASGEQQRVLGQQGQGIIGLNEGILSAFRRAGPGEINKYFEEAAKKNQAFGLDINKFGEQAVKFEKAWTNLKDTLDRIWESLGQKYIDSITNAMDRVNNLLQGHSKEIVKAVEEIATFLSNAFNKLIDGITNLIDWWDKLSPVQKEATEAILAFGVAIFSPYGKLVLLVGILESLPWDTLKEGFTWLVNKLGELEEATNGVITPWRVLEGLFALIVLSKIVAFFGAFSGVTRLAATGVELLLTPLRAVSTVLGEIAGFLSGGTITALLMRLGVIAPFVVPSNNTPNSAEESRELERLRREGPNQTGSPIPHQERMLDPIINWFKNLKLSDLNPIGAARADELPDRLKKLTEGLNSLNDTLVQHFMDMLSDPLGIGGGSSGGGGGGGSLGGGGSGKGVKWNDPRTISYIKYLMDNGGMSLAQAAGIVGNLGAESSLDPMANGPGGHFGLAQWDQKRQRDFRLIEGSDIHKSTAEQQLHFLLWELNNTEKKAGDKIKGDTDQRQSADDFFKMFERAGDASGTRRMDYADTMYNQARPLLAGSPNNIQTNTDSNDKNVNITQHNNTTVNGSADPHASAQALEQVQQYNSQLLMRQLSSPFQ